MSLDLDPIKKRCEAATAAHNKKWTSFEFRDFYIDDELVKDIPALIAEIEHLRAELDNQIVIRDGIAWDRGDMK